MELYHCVMNKKLCYHRGTAQRAVSQNLVNCCTAVQKIKLERYAEGSDLEGDSRSSELPMFDKPYVTSC